MRSQLRPGRPPFSRGPPGLPSGQQDVERTKSRDDFGDGVLDVTFVSNVGFDDQAIDELVPDRPVRPPVPCRWDLWDVELRHGMDNAIADIIALGGTLKKPPSLYPRPGAYGDEPPAIDWAVMQDPFGNEFCIVEELTPQQQTAAMASNATNDHDLRTDAGVTGPKHNPHAGPD